MGNTRQIYSTILFIFFYFYDYLLQVTISIMPVAEYNLSPLSFSIISGAFFIGYVLPQSRIGSFIDRGHFKLSAVTLVLICLCGLFIFNNTNSTLLLVIARFIMGVGSSCSCIIAIYAISNWFSSKYQSVLVGSVQAAACLGGIFGQAVLAQLIERYGWHGALNILLLWGLGLFVLYFSVTDVKLNSESKSAYSNASIINILRNKQILALSICGFVAWCAVSVLASTWVIKILASKYSLSIYGAAKFTIFLWLGLGTGSYIILPFSNYIQSRKITIYFIFSLQFLAYLYLIFSTSTSILLLKLVMFTIGLTASVQTLSLAMVAENKNTSCLAQNLAVVNLVAAFSGGLINPILGYLIRITDNMLMALLILPLLTLIGIYTAYKLLQDSYTKHSSTNLSWVN